MPLTSAADIKSWTARRPTASAPHSHALNLVRINPLLCGLRRSDRLSQRLHPPTRLEPQHGMDVQHESSVHGVFSPCRLQTRMSALVRLRSPTCFVAPSAYPRDIHASSEFTDSLTLDATRAWWAARRRRTRCLRRDLTGSFRLEPVTILAAVVESFSAPESGDGAGAVCGGSSGREPGRVQAPSA